jgi:hypothetical protein
MGIVESSVESVNEEFHMRVELSCIFERNWNLMPDWIHDSIFNPTKGTVGDDPGV